MLTLQAEVFDFMAAGGASTAHGYRETVYTGHLRDRHIHSGCIYRWSLDEGRWTLEEFWWMLFDKVKLNVPHNHAGSADGPSICSRFQNK